MIGYRGNRRARPADSIARPSPISDAASAGDVDSPRVRQPARVIVGRVRSVDVRPLSVPRNFGPLRDLLACGGGLSPERGCSRAAGGVPRGVLRAIRVLNSEQRLSSIIAEGVIVQTIHVRRDRTAVRLRTRSERPGGSVYTRGRAVVRAGIKGVHARGLQTSRIRFQATFGGTSRRDAYCECAESPHPDRLLLRSNARLRAESALSDRPPFAIGSGAYRGGISPAALYTHTLAARLADSACRRILWS